MAELANSSHSLAAARLGRVMAMAGWEIRYIDLDLTQAQAQAEIKVFRDDGRWLWAKVDAQGRSSMETFQRDRALGMDPSWKAGRLAPRVDDVFLGRQSFREPLAMLGGLTAYLAGNSLRPVALDDLRAGWASIMGAPLKLEHGYGVMEGQGLSGEAWSAATKRCFDTGGNFACADVSASRCTVCPNRKPTPGVAACAWPHCECSGLLEKPQPGECQHKPTPLA